MVSVLSNFSIAVLFLFVNFGKVELRAKLSFVALLRLGKFLLLTFFVMYDMIKH